MRVVVDVMGGDHGPAVVIDGVRQALQSNAKVTELFLVGKKDEIEKSLQSLRFSDSRLQIIHASEVLTMEDKPVEGLRRKKDCSILRGMELLKEGKADVIISPGNTGGLTAAGTIRLRPIEGVERIGIATVIPCPKNEFVLLDSGANVESKPAHLVHYAVMGSVYSREVLGYSKPRVAILSNGTEENKGNELTQETLRLCKNIDINLVGYVEGHDLFNDHVDVVVCDGFVGNIVLKTIESFAKGMAGWMKSELTKNPVRMLGALLAGSGLKSIKRRMDPDAYGGAPLLGLNGVVIKAHGSARERAIMNAIRIGADAARQGISNIIRAEIAAANARLEALKLKTAA